MPISVPKFVFGLPPEDIIKWFEKKGYAFSWSWHDLWQDEHVRAFTVAKAMKLDILESIRKELDESMKSGMLFSDFQRKLEQKLKKLGWWGKIKAEDVPGYDPASGIDPDKEVWLGSPWRLVTIYNTNVDTAYSAGRWRGQKEAALTHPYLQYLAVMDDRTRDEHAALDGKVFHINDPFWDYFYPPNGWNCRCRVRSLTEKQVKERKLHVEQTGPNNFGFDEFLNPDGSVDRTAWYGAKMKKTSTERGWSYNPGKVDWEPDLKKYPKDLQDLFRKDTVSPEAQKVEKFVPAKTIREAEDWAKKRGVNFVEYKGMNITKANQINAALNVVPDRALPDFIVNKSTYNKMHNKLSRKDTEWYGVSTQGAMIEVTPELMSTGNLANYEVHKSPYGGGTIMDNTHTVCFSPAYKDFAEVAKRKQEINDYLISHGKEKWFFNTDSQATPAHELGHVYLNKNYYLHDDWLTEAEKWYKETKFGSLSTKGNDQSFNTDKNGNEAFAEAFAEYFNHGGKRLPSYVLDFFRKRVK